MIRRDKVEEQWANTIAAIEKLGGNGTELLIDPPASLDAVEKVESSLGHELPENFKKVLLTFSKNVSFRWSLPESLQLPEEFKGIFCGHIHWSLDWLVDFEEGRKDWVRKVFPNPQNPYDIHWHDKLAFYEVGNGDYLSIDLSEKNFGAIVYLSHDDGEGHGLRMASSFENLIRNWTLIGGVGGEDWQWLPFYDHQASEISPVGKAAQRFQKLIGFSVPESL
ncbi:MAG: SMI1/KNR4 family protein [Pseudomonadota bacterium]